MKALQAEHDLGHGVASPIEPETIRTRQSRTFSMGGSRDLVHEGVHVSAKTTGSRGGSRGGGASQTLFFGVLGSCFGAFFRALHIENGEI